MHENRESVKINVSDQGKSIMYTEPEDIVSSSVNQRIECSSSASNSSFSGGHNAVENFKSVTDERSAED